MIRTKKCKGECGLEKTVENFHKETASSDGYRNRCKSCLKAKRAEFEISGVYKVTAPDGKVYIGESDDIEFKRFKAYKSYNCRSQRFLYESLIKYGSDNHTYEIIEMCDKDIRKCRERYWQEYYDVLNPDKGLNGFLTDCGDKKVIRREDVYERMRLNRIGKGLGENSAMAEPVINTKSLKTYVSAKEAFKESDMESYDYFKSKLNGGRKNDTYFMYIKDYEKQGAIEPVYVKPAMDPVVDTYTKIEYPSTSQAAEALGIVQSVLRRYITGERVNNSFVVAKEHYVEGEIHWPKDGKKRRIVCDDNEEVYLGMPDIVKAFNIPLSKVIKILKHGEKEEGVNIRFYEPEKEGYKLIKYMYNL